MRWSGITKQRAFTRATALVHGNSGDCAPVAQQLDFSEFHLRRSGFGALTSFDAETP